MSGWAYVENTGCFAWTGKTGRGGKPVVYKDGQQTPASRAQWERLYGALPGRLQLTGICGRVDCVSPYHHVLKSPERALASMGITAKAVSRLARTLEEIATLNPDLPICWSGPVVKLALPPDEVARLATALRSETLFIHAAFAKLAQAAKPAEKQFDRPITETAIRLMQNVTELRAALGLPPTAEDP